MYLFSSMKFPIIIKKKDKLTYIVSKIPGASFAGKERSVQVQTNK